MNEKTVKYILARAGWTFCESMLAFITLGIPIWQIDWKTAIGISLTATVYSIGKSIVKGTPEDSNDK